MDRFSSLYRRISCAVLLAALCVAGASTARAQSANAGTITGTVTDPTGAVIPGATITVSDAKSATSRTTVTNKDGQFVVPDMPIGTYDVKVTKPGFSTDEIPDLTVNVGTQSTANFKLAVGAESTVISVEASNADLQTINATTGQTVEQAMVNSLPAIGRDVATFVTMQPGVSPAGYVAGTAQDQASISLDGGQNSADMDGTQGVYTSNNLGSTTGGFLGAGASGVMPMPQDSIEEFKVSTSGQTADFNNSTGSNSQVVTKRGHDTIHGTVYEYYLDNTFNANSWQNNFPGTGYTPKPSYHFSRFGAAAGGPILPKYFGGKTYLFANYEGFRYPAAATYERTIPSYNYLQNGQLTFAANEGGCTFNGSTTAPSSTCSSQQLTNADPRGLGFNSTMKTFYQTQLPVAPASLTGSTGGDGKSYYGTFDQSCGALSTSYCDGVNTIGYKANISIPQSSNFLATRLDHDFGDKWHFMATYRYYNLQNVTSNQVDIGGVIGNDKLGVPTALTPRPQQPWFLAVGMTTNISSSLTNDFHYSYLRNFWQWKGAGAPAQISGAGGVIEPLGENTTTVLAPYNVNAQNIRTRIWLGKDNFFRDDLTKIKGNHVLQAGFQYQHNFNYHQRTDNGASINYTPTYQIGDSGGGGNVAYSATGLGSVGAGTANYARILDTYYGIVTDTQVANTYTNNGGTLTLNPAATPIGAHTTIPYYNIYGTDTWKVTPTLTLNYGISYAIEMPPHEANGNQVMWTDPSGNEQSTDKWLENRYTAAAQGTVYNPYFAFALLKNVDGGGRKYAYNPYYASVSPRISFAWNPKFTNEGMAKIFGSGATVIRGGYGRLYARINGDLQVLNPLLSPGLILATQCKYAQASGCNSLNFNDNTAYRFGVDGTSPVLASAPAPTTLPQPYRPGIDGPGVSIASPLDPSLRPSYADTFNLSIQRQIGHRQLLEVGYIGRYINHDYIMKNPNQVPYNLALNGQSFAQAYAAVESAMGCTQTAAACKATTTSATSSKAATRVFPIVSAQPFFEAALGGASSPYCAYTDSISNVAATSCTQALVMKQASKFGAQQVFSLWQALDNNMNGANGAGFTFNRSLAGTATSNTTYGSAGQTVTGISIGTPDGWANYHGGYVSYKISGFHGITLQENLTWSKALGLGTYNQSTSSITAQDSYNLANQYGRQSFDQKIIFNTFVVYQTPWFKGQNGIIGRLAGGWTFSPVVTAGTGQPLQCTSNNSGQNFGGEDGSTFTDSETCIFTKHEPAVMHTYRGITGSTTGTSVKGPGSAAVNMFSNPDAVYATVRAPILGYDTKDSLSSTVSGLGYMNVDLSVKKEMRIFDRYSLEFSGVMFNALNHLDFANPSLSLQSTSAWGVTKTQGNTPRQIQMGVRANF
ncbi:Carboxypeptidase regulatory-like domain-containing protein [Bryocella elongata]|uniref:Carboxypeptidase regulatory-like domain-containing protein n=1 Tax=Bryocella elongata TaxID=863522 RepID=A0A1H5VV10_9BACT|nr:carboxypeptidase-like regulatory domain-containing protein [Bryocella elongata]SEF90701.1 Carboxypeptidase regulatory-like domain-containing protein [Bryocella elongata]